jgi:hypothetical protein
MLDLHPDSEFVDESLTKEELDDQRTQFRGLHGCWDQDGQGWKLERDSFCFDEWDVVGYEELDEGWEDLKEEHLTNSHCSHEDTIGYDF